MNWCDDCPFRPCFCPKCDSGAECCRSFVCPDPDPDPDPEKESSDVADFHFCNRIRRYRKALNLTQSDLALKVGVSKNAISSFERGEYHPSVLTALFLCFALGCSFEDLFYLD